MNRDFKLALYWAGRSPEIAFRINPNYSISDYEIGLTDTEFLDFAVTYDTNFSLGIDGMLMYKLVQLSDEINKAPSNEKLYKAYTDLLKLTTPILEKLYRSSKEAEHYDGLELIIRGVNEKN